MAETTTLSASQLEPNRRKIMCFLPKIFAVALLLLALLLTSFTPVWASSAENESTDSIAITVIVPPLPERPATPAPPVNRVYPVNVSEGYNFDGVRELVRVYELLPDENPDWIDTDSFTRNGYYYQLADIVRLTDIAHTVREHTEIIEVQSATNDLAGVIAGLSQTLDFVDEEGYAGVLHLDIRSIEMTQDGSRSTSRTVTETREYPHLSNPDLSLIPQTITASNRAYNLADVDWRTNTATPVDFNSVAQTYTAVATYTRTATSTVATGFTTKAEYSGTLTRISTGDVRFVATFIGTPIVSPIVNRPEPSTTPTPEAEEMPCVVPSEDETAGAELSNADEQNGEDIIEENGEAEGVEEAEPVDLPSETVQENNEGEPKGSFPLWLLLLALPFIATIVVMAALMFRFKKKADTLERKSHTDSADALYSRMKGIVRKDRDEIAAADDEQDDYDEDEDLDATADDDLSFSFDGVDDDFDEENYPDKDGEDDD